MDVPITARRNTQRASESFFSNILYLPHRIVMCVYIICIRSTEKERPFEVPRSSVLTFACAGRLPSLSIGVTRHHNRRTEGGGGGRGRRNYNYSSELWLTNFPVTSRVLELEERRYTPRRGGALEDNYGLWTSGPTVGLDTCKDSVPRSSSLR